MSLLSTLEHSINKKKYYEIFLLKIIFILPFFFCVLRPLNSTDTEGYLYYFVNASLSNPKPEISYVLISFFSKLIGGEVYGFRIVLFIYTLLGTLLLFKILEKSDNIALSFFVYFSFAYLYQMNIQMRSCVANLIFLYSIYDIEKKNWKLYYLKMLLAFFFHNSSIFFFVIYPYSCFLIKRRKLLFYMPLFFVFCAYFFGAIISFIISFADSTGFYALRVLKTYTEFSKHYVNPLNRFSLFIFLVYYFYLFKFSINKLKDIEVISLSIMALSIFCYFFGSFHLPIIAERYPEALNLIFVYFFPLLEKRIKEKYIFVILVYIYLTFVNMQYCTFSTLVGYFL